MKIHRILRSATIGAVALLCSYTSASGAAEAYPARAVSIIVPFSPGGGSDNIARLIANKLSERIKKQFIIINRPGGGTNIGNDLAARAAGDGYTLLFGQVTLSINPNLYTGLHYNVQKDFVPIIHIATSPTVLVVSNSFPAHSVQELIAYAKAHPGKLNFASGGVGTSVHLAGELFKDITKTNMMHIAYKGSGPAVADLIGDRVQLMFDTAPSALSHIVGKQERALAVTGSERLPEIPDVPTFAEAGVKGFDAPAWYALLAPAHTPASVVSYLNKQVNEILAEPSTKSQLQKMGAVAVGGTPEQLSHFMQQETERWDTVIKKARVTVD